MQGGLTKHLTAARQGKDVTETRMIRSVDRWTGQRRWSDVFGCRSPCREEGGTSWGFVVVGSGGLLLKPGVLGLGPGRAAGIRREEGKGWTFKNLGETGRAVSETGFGGFSVAESSHTHGLGLCGWPFGPLSGIFRSNPTAWTAG